MSSALARKTRIPVCEPFLDGPELDYVIEAVRTNWISSNGRFIREFEEGFSGYVGAKHGIGTTSGTTALHLALVSAGIAAGDEVILPTFTMIASAFALCYIGAIPVFVDAEADTWTLDVDRLEEKVTAKTKAIMAVHIYGHPCDMSALRALCDRRGLLLIVDGAESIGAEVNESRRSTLGDIAAFSFYANKNITTGEGGMVVTDSDKFERNARYFKNLCFPTDGPRNYLHEDIGFNYRMSNLHAAIGAAQLKKADAYVDARRRNAGLYDDGLAGCNLIATPVEKPWAKNCYWMYGVVLTDAATISRDQLMKELGDDGIETRPFFMPMHRQPALKKYGADCSGLFPVADHLSQNGFYLPSSTHLTPETIALICRSLKNSLR